MVSLAEKSSLLRYISSHGVTINAGITLILICFTIIFSKTVIYLPVFFGSDAGTFYVVFDALSRGERLYIDIFDHKDPIFYYGYALAYLSIGLMGPMLWEGFLAISLIVIVITFLSLANLRPLDRLVLGLIFTAIYFWPRTYFPIHTYHQALVSFMLAALLIRRGLFLWAGCAIGIAIFSKMTLLLFIPALGWLALFLPIPTRSWKEFWERIGKIAIGSSGIATLLLAVLLIRGEFFGYIEIVRYNVAYVSLRESTGGFSHLFSQSRAYLGSVTIAFIFALSFINAVLFMMEARRWFRNIDNNLRPSPLLLSLSGFAFFTSVGVLALLLQTSSWPHYFQPVGIASVLNGASLLLFSRLHFGRFALLSTGLAALSIITVLWLYSLFGFMSWQTLHPNAIVLSHARSFQEMTARYQDHCLFTRPDNPSGIRHIATFMQGDYTPLLLSRSQASRFGCRLFYQFEWLTGYLTDEYLECLDSENIDIVLLAPLYYPMVDFEQAVRQVVAARFTLVRKCGDIEVWGV